MSIEAMKQVVKEAVYHRGGYWIVPEKDFSSLCQAIAEAEKQEPVMGVEVKRSASGGFIGNVWWINESLKEGVFHLYTHPQPKREWVELTGQQKNLIARISVDVFDAIHRTGTKLKGLNT